MSVFFIVILLFNRVVSMSIFSSAFTLVDTTFSFVTSLLFPPAEHLKIEFDDLEYPFKTHILELPGNLRVAYCDEGEGDETILFVHGLGSYIPAWQKNIRELRSQYRCIALDLPGFGKSSKQHSITLDFYAHVVKGVIDKLGLKNVTLCGHSMGGQISILAALRNPKTVTKLILIAPSGIEVYSEIEQTLLSPFTYIPWTQFWSPAQIYAVYHANFYEMPPDAMFMIRDRIGVASAEDFPHQARITMECIRAMALEPVFSRLSSIKQRTMIVFGRQDALIPNRLLHGGTPKDIAKLAESKIPNSKLVMVNYAGHIVQFEQAEEVNREIMHFLG
jgi:pimeloyl-ACP methyl ester carboxylesterase